MSTTTSEGFYSLAMQIHNMLPVLLRCLERWPEIPSREKFEEAYEGPLSPLLKPMLDDFKSFRGIAFHDYISDSVNWTSYRAEALRLDPAREEARVRKQIQAVEDLLGKRLEGEAVLFGSFTMMDGYARFDRGTHRVFLGVDEDHAKGNYLDILISHELTHVARESVPSVWQGFGLTLQRTHDEFTATMPVAEHVLSEGYSCVISELLNPGEKPSSYTYQTEESYAEVMKNSAAVDEVVHRVLKKPPGSYRELYDTAQYVPEVPRFAHYVWAWKWAKHLLENSHAGDPRKLLGACARNHVEDALSFRLS